MDQFSLFTQILPIEFLTTPVGVSLPIDHDVDFYVGKEVIVQGHVMWFSETKRCKFAKLYDTWETQHYPLQLVFDKKGKKQTESGDEEALFDFDSLVQVGKIQKGSHLCVSGVFVKSPKDGQPHELQVKKIISFSEIKDYDKFILAGDDYTLNELHRHIEHQARSHVFSTIWGLSDRLEFIIRDFFMKERFTQIRTPLITYSECESGCKPLQVTQLFKDGLIWKLQSQTDPKDFPKHDFFGRSSFLTVSGQLELRPCLPMGKIWTWTTAVRGEPSATRSHLAEFRMIEPEFPSPDEFYAATQAEKLIVHCIREMLQKYRPYLEFLTKQTKFGLDPNRIQKLESYISNPFVRITHAEAITLLKEQHNKSPFKEEPKYDDDLGKEHEKWLTDEHFKHPVIVFRYPEVVKAFYMPYVNETEEESHGVRHVRCFDILVPEVGELVGGSQRIHKYEELIQKITDREMDPEPLKFFTETIKHSGFPHAGFGLGYERFVMFFCSCIAHDTIPYPRAYEG